MSNTNDVVFNRRFLSKNSEFKVTYTGNLYKNNSESVYIRYGYGENWEHQKEQQMLLNNKGFYAKIIPEHEGDFNFCFRNSNNEYDNNNYQNFHASIGKEFSFNSQPLIDIDALIDEILSSDTTSSKIEFEVTPSTPELKFEVVKTQEEILADTIEDLNKIVSSTETKSSDKNVYVKDTIVPYYLLDENQEITKPSEAEQKDFVKSINNIIKTAPIEEFVTESQVVENAKTYENKVEDYTFVTDSFIPETVTVEEPVTVASTITQETNTTSLAEYNVSSPRKLSKFYFFKKRVRLAIYRLLVTIPKLLTGNFGRNSNH